MTPPVPAPPVTAGLCFLPQSVTRVVIMSVKGLAVSSSILKLPEDIDNKTLWLKNKAVAYSTDLQHSSSQATTDTSESEVCVVCKAEYLGML